jgi:branched-chain amino acid transport system ATP-binding protein
MSDQATPSKKEGNWEHGVEPLIQVRDIEVVYNSIILAVRGVTIDLNRGQTVALLGPNGAGKTTTLKAVSRLITPEGGAVSKGEIQYEGEKINSWDAYKAVKRGIVQVLEGRQVFPSLSVEQNLLVAAYSKKIARGKVKNALEKIFEYFPRLKERRKTRAGYTSGGEQQMLAMGRALMLNPKVILLDEPSMGLAPLVVEEIFEIIGSLSRNESVSILLAEQNASIALRYADYGYVIETGRVVMSGSAKLLQDDDSVKSMYLGIDESGSRQEFGTNRRQMNQSDVFAM